MTCQSNKLNEAKKTLETMRQVVKKLFCQISALNSTAVKYSSSKLNRKLKDRSSNIFTAITHKMTMICRQRLRKPS